METSSRFRYVCSVIGLVVGACRADEVVTLHYYERPPFMVHQADGSATGLTADRAREAFTRAGVAFRWSLTPAKRQLALIRANGSNDCGVGWFRNPERESFANFTDSIYEDRAVVVLAQRQFQPAPGMTLQRLLANRALRVLMKDGLTYGSYVIKRIRAAKAEIQVVAVEQPQMVRMIAGKRADIMFATQEEADMLVTGSETGAQAVAVLSFPDIPPGERRYIMCSKRVGRDILDRLNAAIRAGGHVRSQGAEQ